MTQELSKNRYQITYNLKSSLFKNSLFILLTSVSSSGFGFIFWMLAAKLYTPNDVGIATALISSIGFLTLLTRFGMDSSIIRFFPTLNKHHIFNTSATVTTLSAVFSGIVFIIVVDFFASELYFLKLPLNALLFLIILAVDSLTVITATSFVALRESKYQFLQSIIIGLRVIFLFPLVTLGGIGILTAVGISGAISLFVTLIMLKKFKINFRFHIDYGTLKDLFHFSVGSYFAGFFMNAPNMILPIIVLDILGAEKAAYYYITYSISSLLYMIPNAISTSLFVEGSHGEALKKMVLRALFAMILFLAPLVLIFYIFAGKILSVIGADYAKGGVQLLRIMVLGSLPIAINYVYFSIKRIQKDVKGLILLNILIFSLLIVLCYILMPKFGLVGIGYAMVISNMIGNIKIIEKIKTGKWIKF